MQLVLTDALATLERGRELADALLQQTDSVSSRASLLAEMMRSLWPNSSLYACMLSANGASHICVLDSAGSSRSDWAETIRNHWTACKDAGMLKQTGLIDLPPALKLGNDTLEVVPMEFQDQCQGILAMAVHEDASKEIRATVRSLLTICSQQLAWRLALEANDRQLRAIEEEQAEQARLADIGEITSPVVHEFSNFLNNMLLHVALLEQEVSEQLRRDLVEIRQEGARLTALLQQLHRYRRQQQAELQPVDLNRVVYETVETFSRGQASPNRGQLIRPASPEDSEGPCPTAAGCVFVHCQLAPVLPPVLGSVVDSKRLVTFLLKNTAAAQGEGVITIVTESATDKVLLQLHDSGPGIAAPLLTRAFEPSVTSREGTNSLELSTCKTLAARMQAKIYAENQAGGGVTITVEFPFASE